MKVVLGTVLEFDSFGELAAQCAECVEEYELQGGEGVPRNWDNPDAWTEDTVYDFLMINGSEFYDWQSGDYDNIFNDNEHETCITIEP